jgi:hypothetical protein
MKTFTKTLTLIRLRCSAWLGRLVPFFGAETYYQAQVRDEYPEWQCWVNIGWQTKSRVCIRRFIAEELAKNPAAKMRVRRVRIWYRDTSLARFMPNVQAQTRRENTKNL